MLGALQAPLENPLSRQRNVGFPIHLPCMTFDNIAAQAQDDVRRALAEDVGSGDLTAALVPANQRIRAHILAREAARQGQQPLPVLEAQTTQALNALGWQTDYLTVRLRDSLQSPAAEQLADTPLVALGAARLGSTRLIDNLEF